MTTPRPPASKNSLKLPLRVPKGRRQQQASTTTLRFLFLPRCVLPPGPIIIIGTVSDLSLCGTYILLLKIFFFIAQQLHTTSSSLAADKKDVPTSQQEIARDASPGGGGAGSLAKPDWVWTKCRRADCVLLSVRPSPLKPAERRTELRTAKAAARSREPACEPACSARSITLMLWT